MADIVFLKGRRVHLRSLEESDLTDVYLQWLNDEEVCKYNSHAVFPNNFHRMKAYFNSLHGQQKQVVLAIIDTKSDKHIGNVSLQNIDWISRCAEFAILIGDKGFWKGGYGEEVMRLVIAYGFERLNLHRIYCGTLKENQGMIKLALKMNMKQEGIRKEAIYKNGAYTDIIEFGLLRKDWND